MAAQAIKLAARNHEGEARDGEIVAVFPAVIAVTFTVSPFGTIAQLLDLTTPRLIYANTVCSLLLHSMQKAPNQLRIEALNLVLQKRKKPMVTHGLVSKS